MVSDLFPRALAFVLDMEGGFSNDPADHGGPTSFGVTQVNYDAYRGTLKLPAQPVAQISRDEAAAIYRTNYWEPHGCGEMSWALGLTIFDTFVQHQYGVASDMLRDVVWADEPEQMQAFALICLRRNLYRRIVQKDPTQSKFSRGWLNRLGKLRQATQG